MSYVVFGLKGPLTASIYVHHPVSMAVFLAGMSTDFVSYRCPKSESVFIQRITLRGPPDEKAGGGQVGGPNRPASLEPVLFHRPGKDPAQSPVRPLSFRETANYVLAVLSDPHA